MIKHYSRGLFILFALFTYSAGRAQNNTGIGTMTPAVSSILELSSSLKGFLMPRVTTAEKLAIAAPATGLVVFDLTINDFYYYNGTAWVPLVTNTVDWLLPGNSGTVAGTNFAGTTDAVDFVVKTNATERVRFYNGGNIGLISTGGIAPQLRFFEPPNSGTAYTSMQAQAQAANITYTWPPDAGPASPMLANLENNGLGVLDWTGRHYYNPFDATIAVATTKNQTLDADAVFVRFSSSVATATIRGLTGGTNGRVILVVNKGAANDVAFVSEHASATAANRIYFRPGLASPVTLNPGEWVFILYDANAPPGPRWRILR